MDAPGSLELELAQVAADEGPTVVVDDGDALGDEARDALRRAVDAGAKLVWVGDDVSALGLVGGAFVVPPLDEHAAAELVQRSVPSLPDALRTYLVTRVGGRPGALRAAVRQLAGKVVVSREDVDAALGATSRPSMAPLSAGRAQTLEAAERALDMGRFDESAQHIEGLGPARGALEEVRFGIARARIALGRGDTARAVSDLSAVEARALASESRRLWQTVRARAHLRAGEYAEAARLAQLVVEADPDDPLSADALSTRGVALAFTGEDTLARKALEEAVRVARATGEPRIEAVALGSAAIAHQRAGRTVEARAAYEGSLASAEKARDAATVAAMRLNLAGLARAEGDLAQALAHLEAAADMGRRAGSGFAVTQALLNLANLDLYLGRWARARGSIDQLAAKRDELSPAALAQLLGLEAEHAARTGDLSRGAQLYEETARAWEAQGRTHDAAESRLEG
ncbi:MAG: sigma-54-dependent Fis family transcriptional regulator, partial [Polyangiaceae bacterium]